jgi:uncharacterized protein (DUF2141 family)
MKVLVLLTLLALSVTSVRGVPDARVPVADCTATISVTGLKNTDGTLNAALYDSPETWLGETGITRVAAIDSSSVTVHFDSLPCRSYAAAVYHDANGNGKLDRNLIGIPIEDYGFSNNPKAVFGPASWEDARFDVVEPQIQLVIRL